MSGVAISPILECPVCTLQKESLVRHHDHFEDFCKSLLWKSSIPFKVSDESYWEGSEWSTFVPTKICLKCNSICPDVKKKIPSIPKCASFSPSEMRILIQEGISTLLVQKLWAQKKEEYRVRLRKLVELGVPKDHIEKAWRDRTVPVNETKIARERMLKDLQKMPPGFKELCDKPGQDAWLAYGLAHFAHWDYSNRQSFIFWYHKRHGDPGCKHNHLGVGQTAFARWFCKLSERKTA